MTIAAKMRKEKKKALRPRFKLYGFFSLWDYNELAEQKRI